MQINEQWQYVYRTVDKCSDIIDFYLSALLLINTLLILHGLGHYVIEILQMK